MQDAFARHWRRRKHIKQDEIKKPALRRDQKEHNTICTRGGRTSSPRLHSAQDSETSLSSSQGVIVTKRNCASSDVPVTSHSVVYRPGGDSDSFFGMAPGKGLETALGG